MQFHEQRVTMSRNNSPGIVLLLKNITWVPAVDQMPIAVCCRQMHISLRTEMHEYGRHDATIIWLWIIWATRVKSDKQKQSRNDELHKYTNLSLKFSIYFFLQKKKSKLFHKKTNTLVWHKWFFNLIANRYIKILIPNQLLYRDSL